MGKCEYHRTQLGLKQSSLGGTVSKNHKIQLIFTAKQIHSASLSTGEDRVVLTFGELERVPALTVTSPVRCSFLHERRALFFATQSPVWQSKVSGRLWSKLNLHFALFYH